MTASVLVLPCGAFTIAFDLYIGLTLRKDGTPDRRTQRGRAYYVWLRRQEARSVAAYGNDTIDAFEVEPFA